MNGEGVDDVKLGLQKTVQNVEVYWQQRTHVEEVKRRLHARAALLDVSRQLHTIDYYT